MADFNEIIKLSEPSSCLTSAVRRVTVNTYRSRPEGAPFRAVSLVRPSSGPAVLPQEAFHAACSRTTLELAAQGQGLGAAAASQRQFQSICNYYSIERASLDSGRGQRDTPVYLAVQEAPCLLKLFLPETGHNFQGLILGPRGQFLDQTKQFLGAAAINLRGRGSQRLRTAIVNEGDEEELHVRMAFPVSTPGSYGLALQRVVRGARIWFDVARRALGPDQLNYYKRVQLDWSAPQPMHARKTARPEAFKAEASRLFGQLEARWERVLRVQDGILATFAPATAFYFQCLAEAQQGISRREAPGPAVVPTDAKADESDDLLPPGLD